MPSFQKTHAELARATERARSAELSLEAARNVLQAKFADHARQFKPQITLAEKMGIGAPYLNDLIKGKRSVSTAQADTLLGVSLEVGE